MNDDFESTLSTALRDRVADEQPDLAGLVDGSVRTGIRLRRRRRAGMAAAGVAAVATIAAGSSLLADGGPARSGDPGLAAEPTTSPTPAAEPRPTDIGPLEDYLATLDVGYGVDPGKRVVQPPTELGPEQRARVAALLPSGWRTEYVDPNAPVPGLVTKEPVTVPKEWTCSWYLADDKASCTATGGRVAGLVIRPKSEYAEWSTSSDKGGPGSGAYVTDLHGRFFISVQGGQNTTDADLRELRDGLVWKD